MRSLYARIVLWCFSTLILSLIAFFVISNALVRRRGPGPFESLGAFVMDSARESLALGGPPALDAYLRKLNAYFHGEHYLLDPNGRDLATGADRRDLLRFGRSGFHHLEGPGERDVIISPSRDGHVLFVTVAPPPFRIGSLLPYYLLILAVVAALCWLLAFRIVSPLRTLAAAVDRFGGGELSARVEERRSDEIGLLARSFNGMARRIETLLTAERQLLQDISHELRSPLARLSFAVELSRNARDRDAAVARMKKDVDRLGHLVGALVEMTRAEGDPAAWRPTPVAIDALVRETVADSDIEAEARGCGLEVSGASEASVQGDAELLRRAIDNVVRNAIRYSPPGGTVHVTVERNGASVQISVRDQGPGVPEDLLPKLFQPFFRVDDSRDAATGGVGLGLAIARRAVQLHHGDIAAANAQPGLLVTVKLPAGS
jgi:two-component system sensor histidine kinase CpxA